MRYSIEFAPSAARELRKLDSPIRLKLAFAIDALSRNPRPNGVTKLKAADAWRIRLGDYRIVYEIIDRRLAVMVLRLAHRRDVYR